MPTNFISVIHVITILLATLDVFVLAQIGLIERPLNNTTIIPSNQPTKLPTVYPSNYPSNYPSSYPSNNASNYPSNYPSNYASNNPSNYPSHSPSKYASNNPSKYPSHSPTASILDLAEFSEKGICDNLLDASIRLDDISLNECINLCQQISLTECKMINYFDFWKSNDDSRCYIFNELCLMSSNVENSINSSHIWYKNQLTKQYCMDYRNYLDVVADSCQYYTDYGWCNNGIINEQRDIAEFDKLKSEWTAIDACCDCGGGKLVVDGISISYIDNDNINKDLLECSFKTEQHEKMINIRKWNNFAAFDLVQYINEQLPNSFDSNLLVFDQIESNDTYSITLCDFGQYDDNDTDNNITNDFFIMMTINNQNMYHLLLNSEFFDIDESILPSTASISTHDYAECLSEIQDYHRGDAPINGILPCWNQYNHPTLQPTEAPLQQTSESIVTTEAINNTESNSFPPYFYGVVSCAGIILLIFMLFIYHYKINRNKQKHKAAESKEMELTVYSDDHFAIHKAKKIDNVLPATTSTSFLISSSNVLDVDDETKPILMFEHENKEREPGSEGYFDCIVDMKAIKQIKKKKPGKLIVQRQYYNVNQIKYINAKCSKQTNGEYGYILFGDNDFDRDRLNGRKRRHYGGQAGIMGKYDRKMGYGIITTFSSRKTPNLKEFKLIMDALFIPLQTHLTNGYDVIYPYPTEQDLRNHRDRYYRDGKQVVHHNIGTGIAFDELTIDYLEYIQIKLKELQHFASERINVDYYYYNPSKDNMFTVYKPDRDEKDVIIEEKKDVDIDDTIYFCPSCSEKKHYLIKFKNCNHRMCEECLCGYIIYDLQYDQETDRQRFVCYAHSFGQCQASLCIDDIKFKQDRCECDECKRNNTDSGNGTILNDDNYNMFKNIMLSFDVKLEIWNKDICPNTKCKKPFIVQKPYEMKENKEYQTSLEHIINDNRQQIDHCNCCGQIRLKLSYQDKLINNDICGVCNYWYCNNCRIYCFYKIDTNFTQEPAKQILNGFIKFNQNKLIKNNFKGKNIAFEICEICWYNYYCHICPHCNYTFCGQCDIEWSGNRINWLNRNDTKNKENEEEEEKTEYKYSIYDINIDGGEEHLKHSNKIKKIHGESSHHKCIKHKEKLEKQEIHKRLIRINDHREKLKKINLENQKKDDIIIDKEAENFKLKQEIKRMQSKMTELKMENQQKENMVLSKHLNVTIEKQKETEQKLQDVKYINIWQWKDDDNKWKSYKKEEMNKIKALRIGELYSFSFGSQNYSIHKLSVDRAQQINRKTNKHRDIRRIRIEKPFNGIQYPDLWKMDNYINCQQKEGGIDNNYTTPILIELDPNKDEIAKKVEKEFYSTVSKKKQKITKIECVQNRYLWDKYYTQKQSMIKSIGLNKLNELNLWHGTHTDIIDKIIKQGFRKEFNMTSAFGEGTYFAKNASYSVNNGYCQSNDKLFKVFQCMVLCGESYVGTNNMTLKNWPIKGNGNEQIYDSLVNNIKNPSIYVIHDDIRVYPMFIIHFK